MIVFLKEKEHQMELKIVKKNELFLETFTLTSTNQILTNLIK